VSFVDPYSLCKKQLELKSDEYGFYKFADWLPVRRMLENYEGSGDLQK